MSKNLLGWTLNSGHRRSGRCEHPGSSSAANLCGLSYTTGEGSKRTRLIIGHEKDSRPVIRPLPSAKPTPGPSLRPTLSAATAIRSWKRIRIGGSDSERTEHGQKLQSLASICLSYNFVEFIWRKKQFHYSNGDQSAGYFPYDCNRHTNPPSRYAEKRKCDCCDPNQQSAALNALLNKSLKWHDPIATSVSLDVP